MLYKLLGETYESFEKPEEAEIYKMVPAENNSIAEIALGLGKSHLFYLDKERGLVFDPKKVLQDPEVAAAVKNQAQQASAEFDEKMKKEAMEAFRKKKENPRFMIPDHLKKYLQQSGLLTEPAQEDGYYTKQPVLPRYVRGRGKSASMPNLPPAWS